VWPNTFKLFCVKETFFTLYHFSFQINWVTLKMEASHSSETLEYLTCTQCRIPK
jgi:hypothetical protein